MDVAALVSAGIHHPCIQQYLSVKQHTKSQPEKLACLEGMWALAQACRADIQIKGFFVCPELLRGDAAQLECSLGAFLSTITPAKVLPLTGLQAHNKTVLLAYALDSY